MIKLSDRLSIIANEIERGETVADIGTDHGFLPIYLWENNISPKVIMADISKGSLEKARTNCLEAHPDMIFDLRLGDGIKVLENGEVDAVSIAGMGGILMTEILGDDLDKSKSFGKYILQPRNNVGYLRHWLLANGFEIKNEQLVREGKYICEILTVVPCVGEANAKAGGYGIVDIGEDVIEYQFPETLAEFKNPLTMEYLERHLKKEKFILDSMKSGNKTTLDEIKHQEDRISYIERLVKICESR